MGESVLWIAGVFVLYLVLLPLFGVVLGFFIAFVLPYLVGAFFLFLVATTFELGTLSVWVWLFSCLWGITVFMTRRRLISAGTNLRWHEGHYKAVFATLPLRRNRFQ